MGLTATIDLAQRTVAVNPTPEADLDRFLGGRGLGLSLLWDRVHGPIDPLGPDNPLIFTVAPSRAPRGRPARAATSPSTRPSPASTAMRIAAATSGGARPLRLRRAGRPRSGSRAGATRCHAGAVAIVPAPELWG